MDQKLFSGVTRRLANASQQLFPRTAFNFGCAPKTLVAGDERLIAMEMGYQIVSDYVDADKPLRFLISGAPYCGKTSLGHDFAWYTMEQAANNTGQTPIVLYESAFERSPISLARSLVRKTTKEAEIPFKASLDVLISKLMETTEKRRHLIFLDDLYSRHVEFVNELLLNAEDSDLHIFLSAMPDLELLLKRKYNHTFQRQIGKCRVILPDFDVIHLAAIIKQEAADLFDIPLTTEQALFFAEVDQVLTAKLPVSYGTDRPFITILGQLANYKGRVLCGNACREITQGAAIYDDFFTVFDLSKDAALLLEKVLAYFKLSNEASNCFVDKADIFWYFEELLEGTQIPGLDTQQRFNELMGELEEVGSLLPAEHLNWKYFCFYDIEDALLVLKSSIARFYSS